MPIKVKDMKITRSEAEEKKPSEVVDRLPAYPYGLTLHLNEEIIAKLGLDELPVPGSTGTIAGKVVVESASISMDKDKKRRSVKIQITKLGFEIGTENIEEESETIGEEGGGPPQASAAKVLFGD